MAKNFVNPAEELLKSSTLVNTEKEHTGANNVILKDTEKAKLLNSYVNKKEAKTKRLQLVVQPSLYEQMKAVSQEMDISLNELFNISAKELLSRLKGKK